MLSKFKWVIICFVIFIFAFIGYMILAPKDGSDGKTISKLVVGPDANNSAAVSGGVAGSVNPGNEFVTQLLTIKNITFKTGVFEDEVFRSLKDFSQPIAPQPIGRNNPFAPVGADEVLLPPTTQQTPQGAAPVKPLFKRTDLKQTTETQDEVNLDEEDIPPSPKTNPATSKTNTTKPVAGFKKTTTKK